MKKVIISSIVTTSLLSFAQQPSEATVAQPAPAQETAQATTTAPRSSPSPFSSEAFAAADAERKRKADAEAKTKNRPSLWSMIKDFSITGLMDKFKLFREKVQKQNIEAIEGAETGQWKHTKRRLPANGKTKELADKLDKIQQEKLNKYDKIDTGL
jgi:hypothetical protein